MLDILKARGSVEKTGNLPPRVFLEKTFTPLTGMITVTVVATASREDIINVRDPVTGHMRFQNVRLDVTLLDAAGVERSSKKNMLLPRPGHREKAIEFRVPPSLENQEWTVRIHNVGPSPRSIDAGASIAFEEVRTALFGTTVPLRVLNHALTQMLLGLGLHVRFNGSKGFIDLSPSLSEVLPGIQTSFDFDLPAAVAVDINMETFKVRADIQGGGKPPRGGPFLKLFVEFETIGDVEIQLHGANLIDVKKASIEVDVLLRSVQDAKHRGHLQPVFFVRENIDLDFPWLLDVVDGARQLGQLIRGEDRETLEESLRRAVKGALEQALIKDVAPVLSQYAREVFLQLASRENTFYKLTAEDDAFVVWHRDRKQRPSTGKEADSVGLLLDNFEGGTDPAIRPGRPDPALARLTNINTFVVLMQENRSFDHMLGYLSLDGRKDIDGLRGDERNEAPGGLVNGINRLADTKFDHSPPHDHGPVMEQIAEGNMTGFLASFREKYPHDDLNPGKPDRESSLSFYGKEQLPVYDFLAANYLVCDKWFCTFPGATQPNRYCTLNGFTPTLENLEPDDPRMGYLPEKTIFDRLPKGTDWVYFESDVATLRFYDRYRLDDKHIIPFDDPHEGFAIQCQRGTLPPVVFIDPDFVDVPFGSFPTDDHPPADVADGQEFIAKVYDSLLRSPNWANTMFIITYDEHGGFHDHVPPPGTQRLIDDALHKKLPLPPKVTPAHADGPPHLGVRVPTFVISPWVSAGAVSSEVFDHTSIAKTILLRLHGENAFLPSKRMQETNHLGHLVNNAPRADRPILELHARPRRPRSPDIPDGGAVPKLNIDNEKDEFHEAVRRFGKPLPRKN